MRIVLHSKYGQLGNRIILITHFIKYALKHNVKLEICNFQDYENDFDNAGLNSLSNKGIHFKELSFQDKIFRFLGYRFPNLVKNRVVIWDIRSSFDKKDRTCIIEDNIPNAQLIFPDGWLFRTAYLTGNDKTWVKALFRPNKQVSENLTKFEGYFKNNSVVGLHIRRGDYKTFLGGKYYFELSYYSKLIEEIKNEFPQSKIIICSDEKLPEEFKQIEGVKVSESDFLTDLFLLSNCRYIIGPPSTFSLLAGYIGDSNLMHVEGGLEIDKLKFKKVDKI